MPYVILKPTNGVNDGTVLLQRLVPNTSQKNGIYDGAGKTQYLSNPSNYDPVLRQPSGAGSSIYLYMDPTVINSASAKGKAEGLTAYLIDTIDSGAAAQPLTVANAKLMAAAIIGEVNTNSALESGAINGLLAGIVGGTGITGTGNSTATVADILDILAGRRYVVPAGAEIHTTEAAGAFDPSTNGVQGSFVSGSKKIPAGEDFSISLGSGELDSLQAVSHINSISAIATDAAGNVITSYPYRGNSSVNRGHAPASSLTEIVATDLVAIYSDTGALLDS